MTFLQIVQLLSRKKGSLILSGIFVAALTFFLVTVISPRFKVTTDFMVVQANTQSQDYYSLFKSSEYLGKVLSESLWSERFINAVLETGKVSKESLPTNKSDRLTAWRDMVSVKKNIELGMLSVVVKAQTEKEGEKVMQAVSEVLMTRNAEFRGGDEKAVEIRILSGPITERNPTLKELLFIVSLGFLAGASLMALRLTWRSLSLNF